MNDLHLGPGGKSLKLGLKLTYAGLSRFQGLGDLMVPEPQARMGFALVALPLASRLGFGSPLVSALSHFRQLTHDDASQVVSEYPRPRRGVPIGLTCVVSIKGSGTQRHPSNPYEGRCNPIHAQGKPMTYNRMEAKSMAGEHCRFCGDARPCWSKRRVASSGYVAIRR